MTKISPKLTKCHVYYNNAEFSTVRLFQSSQHSSCVGRWNILEILWKFQVSISGDLGIYFLEKVRSRFVQSQRSLLHDDSSVTWALKKKVNKQIRNVIENNQSNHIKTILEDLNSSI